MTTPSERRAPTERIDLDDMGVDDAAIGPVEMFRLERMDTNQFWMQVYLPDGRSHRFWIGSRGKIKIGHEEEPA